MIQGDDCCNPEEEGRLVTEMVRAHHLDMTSLESGLTQITKSPRDEGELCGIVIRPNTDERARLEECELSPEGGVHGDNWSRNAWRRNEDGSPSTEMQASIINVRLLDLLAGSNEAWELAGDNLVVDFDLSVDYVSPGTRLTIGDALLEVTAEDHSGCSKFQARYGEDALKFVNSDAGHRHNLRGVYAQILKGAKVRVGDKVRRV
jgi:hypothetical protein